MDSSWAESFLVRGDFFPFFFIFLLQIKIQMMVRWELMKSDFQWQECTYEVRVLWSWNIPKKALQLLVVVVVVLEIDPSKVVSHNAWSFEDDDDDFGDNYDFDDADDNRDDDARLAPDGAAVWGKTCQLVENCSFPGHCHHCDDDCDDRHHFDDDCDDHHDCGDDCDYNDYCEDAVNDDNISVDNNHCVWKASSLPYNCILFYIYFVVNIYIYINTLWLCRQGWSCHQIGTAAKKHDYLQQRYIIIIIIYDHMVMIMIVMMMIKIWLLTWMRLFSISRRKKTRLWFVGFEIRNLEK